MIGNILFKRIYEYNRCHGPYLAIAGLALSAAGTGMGIAGAQATKSAMNKKVADEMARQQQLQREARGAYNTSLAQSTSTAANEQIKQGADAALQEYSALNQVPLSASSASAAPMAAGQNSTQQARDVGYTSMLNKPMAQLQGYSNYGLQQWIKNLQAQQQLGAIMANARASANVLPYEVQQAMHSQDALTGIGSLLGSLGGVMGMAGGLQSGASKPSVTSSTPLSGVDLSFLNSMTTPYTSGVGPWGSILQSLGGR